MWDFILFLESSHSSEWLFSNKKALAGWLQGVQLEDDSVSTNSEKISYIQKIRGTNNLNIINFSDNCQLFIVVCYNIFSGWEIDFFYSIFDNLQLRPHISDVITNMCTADCHILVL